MSYLQLFIRYQVLNQLLQCIPSSLTKTHKTCYTFSKLLDIRYCKIHCSVFHHFLLRHMKHVLPLVIYQVFGIVLTIIVCPIILPKCMDHVLHSVIYQLLAIIVCHIILIKTHETCLSFRSFIRYYVLYYILQCVSSYLLRHMKHILPSVIYQVLGIVLVIEVCPIITN